MSNNLDYDLLAAVQENKLIQVKNLIAEGADVNAQNKLYKKKGSFSSFLLQSHLETVHNKMDKQFHPDNNSSS